MKVERFSTTRGVHCLDIFYQSIRKGHRDVFIRCTDDDTHTINIDGEWEEEHESACYMPSIEDIDKIIAKLHEAKKYLQGEPIEIEDGFGSTWSNVCPTCEEERMHVVRPGQAACSKCG